ncbi:MAG: MGMT family protein [Clostridiales bacterium]|nr:MGMT family protein [Clostridiales bacterium]
MGMAAAGRVKKSLFYSRVYALVAQIPPGRVATYGQIALLAGHPRAARQVGYAMSGASADQRLPCHRVVNRLGGLAPSHAFGGYEVQRAMLEREGVTFLENGRVCLRLHLWREYDEAVAKLPPPSAHEVDQVLGHGDEQA